MSKSRDAFRTISEVADWLDTPAHVLRFWESKFTQVKPVKRAGGRRYYRPGDMELLGGIKKLLHDEGLTIKGVQKILREQGVKHVAGLSTLPIEGHEPDLAEDVPVEAAPFSEMATDPEPEAKVLNFARPYPDNSDTATDEGAVEDAEIVGSAEAVEEGAAVETAVASEPDTALDATGPQPSDAPEQPADQATQVLDAAADAEPADPPVAESDLADGAGELALADEPETETETESGSELADAAPITAAEPEPAPQVAEAPEPAADIAEVAAFDPSVEAPEEALDPVDDMPLDTPSVEEDPADDALAQETDAASEQPPEPAPAAPEVEAAPNPVTEQADAVPETDVAEDEPAQLAQGDTQDAAQDDTPKVPPMGLFSRRMPAADPAPEQAEPESAAQTSLPADEPEPAGDILVLSRLARIKRLTPEQAQALAPLVAQLRAHADRLSRS